MAQHRILGMDPYIEAQRWRGFHANMIVAIQEALIPMLLPKYAADIEEHAHPVLAEQRERFIQIYTLSNRQLVTVIDLLSPSNKRPNSLGRSEYLEKRQRLLQAGVNLVGIDLLLQGERLPTNEPLPEGDYYAFVACSSRLPVVEVYYWRLGQPLPTIPVPLLPEDRDVWLNLQAVYEQVYTRARYDVLLDFSQPLPFGA